MRFVLEGKVVLHNRSKITASKWSVAIFEDSIVNIYKGYIILFTTGAATVLYYDCHCKWYKTSKNIHRREVHQILQFIKRKIEAIMNNNDIGSSSNTGKLHLYIHIFIYIYPNSSTEYKDGNFISYFRIHGRQLQMV